MCGIAGILQSDPSLYNKDHLKKMMDSLSHRGPDGEGYWQSPSSKILLGHRRLSIIDLSEAGHQPMHFSTDTPANGERPVPLYSIVHNGEIYNYIELKEELRKKGYFFRSQTDTEVILAAYDHWKEDCVLYFDGMFAFAIWDEGKKELFIARDRLGEKPLFYFLDPGGRFFCFASEMKALWAMGILRNPNLKMLFNFITIGYTDNPENREETFDTGIKKLPASHSLKISLSPLSAAKSRLYWQIDPRKQNSSITDGAAKEQFSSLFASSIKRRLRSDVALGTSLSGGLDSSAIAAISREWVSPTQSHKCFSAVFDDFEKNELPYSRQVAESFQLRQYLVNISAADLLKDWDQLCYQHEVPFGSASVYAQYKVFELARQQDVKVLLDGQGADETLAGYHRYYKWYWQELFRNRKLRKSGELPAAREIGIKESFDYKNKIAAWFPAFASIVMERRYLLRALRMPDLDPEFVRWQSKEAYYAPPDHLNLNGVLYFSSFTHGLEELLQYADRNSMAHGRELRLPFLSHTLLEFIFALPSRFKIRNGWTKWLLRETMNNRLPASIVWRKDKVGFEPPQKKWMEQPALQEAIREAKRKLVKEKILKKKTLDKGINPLPAYDADNYDWRYFSAAALFK